MASKQKGKVSTSSPVKNDDKTNKAMWDQQATKIFIELCVDEVLGGNRPGSFLLKHVWPSMVEKFNARSGLQFDKNQLKNKWDNMRKDWNLWKTLMGGEIGLGWNHAKGTVDATDEWWHDRLAVVPLAAKFRNKAPDHLESLEIMFSNAVATGEFAWTPNSGTLPSRSCDASKGNDPELVEGSNSSGELGFNVGLENMNSETNVSFIQEKRKKIVGDSMHPQLKKTKKIGAASKLSHQIIVNVMESRNSMKSLATAVLNDKPGCSITEVIELMDSIPEIEIGGELYMLGTRVFKERDNREMFVALKRPQVQFSWLKQELARERESRSQNTRMLDT